MFNKRGQELSTSTIVLLILGVIILVLLALGFTSGWGKIGVWLSQSNVDSIKSQCGASCAVNGEYDYCKSPRTLIPTNKTEKIIDSTCYYLATYQPKYGIDGCDMDCGAEVYVFDREEVSQKKNDKGQPISTQQEINSFLIEQCTLQNNLLKGKLLQALGLSTDKKTRALFSYECKSSE
jgi:hypothetical protein